MTTTARRGATVLDIWGKDLAIWIPGYSNIVGIHSPVAQNQPPKTFGDFVVNGGFEGGFDRWQTTKNYAVSSLYISLDTSAPFLGAYSVLFDRSGGGSGQQVADLWVVQAGNLDTGQPFYSGSDYRSPALVAVAPGTSLRVSGAGKWDLTGSGGTLFGRVFVLFYDIAYNNISIVAGPTWSAETTWTPKTASVAVPNNAVYATIAAGIDGIASGTGGKLWMDEVHAMASY